MANENNLTPFTTENQPKNRGRKKGQKNFKTILKKFLGTKFNKNELEEMIKTEISFYNGKAKISIQEALVLQFLLKTLKKCEAKDIELIMNRVDGLLKETFEFTSSPLNIKYQEITKEDLKNSDNVEINE